MKTSLDHLPPHKRDQIAAIAALIQADSPAEMILLFGSYARGDWVEDLVNLYFSDFDIVVLVAAEAAAQDDALWKSLAERAKPIAGRVPVTLLVHDIKQFNQEIRSGQYFYVDILREGIVLHDSRRFQLAQPKALTQAERLELGQTSYRYWSQSAGEFWRGATYYAARGLGPHAAFLLHQATERYYHAALLVFTGYKPKTHDLDLLANQTAPLHPALAGAMPRASAEDERLFKLLKRAYIEARYSKSYKITAEELSILSARVRGLAARVRQACAEKLATFGGADAPSELPPDPSAAELGELPPAPALGDPQAMREWTEGILALAVEREARGEERGRREGLREGQARALVEVLRRRGALMTDTEAARILACRDESLLARWWDRALTAASAADLLDDRQP